MATRRTLFRRALELETGERPGFLARACTDDNRLRREVERLLEALDEVEEEGFLERPMAIENPYAGLEIGSYRLLERIGQGGMGVVYLAERADDAFQMRVAVKFLEARPGDEGLQWRFLAERQILAGLDHPHIAKLLDGGTTQDGVPYLVMEYVEGEPIDQYCERRGLGVRQRLELFRGVCAAVQFAHQSLVVHRDLKPSNILVTRDGVPKLLDFGIAKLLADDDPGEARTATGGVRMTPLYASPEQWTRGAPITTASDVYALGVVLYELLSGRHPYNLENGSYAELLNAVQETEPALPSTVAPPERRGRLVGDVDTIVAKALRKEPGRRYASAEQFAEDIRRHLEGLPVLARKSTLSYRASKFVRRHRWAVAASVLLVVASLVFAVFMAVQRVEVARERDRAVLATDFLVHLFSASDPFAKASPGQGGQVTAREILDVGAAKLGEGLAGDPELQATLEVTVGVIYERLGLYDSARPLLESAAEKSRRLFGAEHPRRARILYALALLRHSEGRAAEASSLLGEALEIQRRELSAEDSQLADSLALLGALRLEADELAAAEPLLEEALEIRREIAFGQGEHIGEKARRDFAKSLNDLAILHSKNANFEEATELFKRALELRESVLGPEHPEVAETVNNLANLLLSQRDLTAAEPLFRRSLALNRKAFGERHPWTAISLINLAAVLHQAGDLDGARPVYEEALEVTREAFGEEHPAVATTIYNYADLHHRTGDLDEAERLFRESMARRRQIHQGDHSDIAESLDHLGFVLFKRGAVEEAEKLLLESLSMWRRIYPKDHPRIAVTLSYLARFYRGQGEPARAEPLARESLEILEALPGSGDRLDPRLDKARKILADCLVDLGRPEEAEQLRVAPSGTLDRRAAADGSRTAPGDGRIHRLHGRGTE